MATNINFKNLTKITFNGKNLTKVILKQGSTSTVVWTGEKDWSAFSAFIPRLSIDSDGTTLLLDNYSNFKTILDNLNLSIDNINVGIVYRVANHTKRNTSVLANNLGLINTKILWKNVHCDDPKLSTTRDLRFNFNLYPEDSKCILRGLTEFIQYKTLLGKKTQSKYYGINTDLNNIYHGYKIIGLILSVDDGSYLSQPAHHTQISTNVIRFPAAVGFSPMKIVEKDTLTATYTFETHMAFLPRTSGNWWPEEGAAKTYHNAFGFVDGDKITTTTDGKCILWREDESGNWTKIQTWVHKTTTTVEPSFLAKTYENIYTDINIECEI